MDRANAYNHESSQTRAWTSRSSTRKGNEKGMGRAKVDHEEAGEQDEEEGKDGGRGEAKGIGTGRQGTRLWQKRWKRAKVSIVKRMEAKKKNYIKKLERSWRDDTWLLVAGSVCWYAARWSASCSLSFFFSILFFLLYPFSTPLYSTNFPALLATTGMTRVAGKRFSKEPRLRTRRPVSRKIQRDWFPMLR